MIESIEPSAAKSSRRRAARGLLWAAAGALVVFVCVWPLISRMAAANDDVGFVRDHRYDGTLWQGIVNSWNQASVFRPLDVIAGRFCDVETLECRPVMLIQVAGLVAMIVGMLVLLRRLMPEYPEARPLLIIWLMLSPATTVSLWQLDSGSQTWSAACGVWLGVWTWMALDSIRAGGRAWTWTLGLGVFMLAAINIKEMMYGWCFGVGLALLAVIARMALKGERRAALRSAWLVLPVIVLPMIHLAIRMKFSAFGDSLESEGGGSARYQASLGLNLIQNAWMSLLGLFGNGPLHLVDDGDAILPLRILTLASLVCAAVLLVSAATLRLLHGRPANAHRGCGTATMLSAAAGLLSISVTLPMGTVSELYGMGANAASGLLVVAALLALWNPAKSEDRSLCRAVAACCAAIIAISGIYGLGSRAYHFRLTWTYAREINRKLLEHQRTLDPSTQMAYAMIGQPCVNGRLHSQYVVPPIQAIGLEGTSAWLTERDPSRAITLVMYMPMSRPGPRDIVIQCDDLPARGHW